ERRLRGVGHPPRSAAEMAEWLRRLGDLSPADLEGPMAALLEQLQAEGRARLIELPGAGAEPRRWVAVEDEDTYRRAFGLTEAAPAEAREAGAAVLARSLQTHALVGLADVLARYPFEPEWARGQLQEWAAVGRAVPVEREGEPLAWSAPANLEQV